MMTSTLTSPPQQRSGLCSKVEKLKSGKVDHLSTSSTFSCDSILTDSLGTLQERSGTSWVSSLVFSRHEDTDIPPAIAENRVRSVSFCDARPPAAVGGPLFASRSCPLVLPGGASSSTHGGGRGR